MLILFRIWQLQKFPNFKRSYLKTSIMALEYFFHYSQQFHSFYSTICLKITFCATNPHSTGMYVTKNSTESSNL